MNTKNKKIILLWFILSTLCFNALAQVKGDKSTNYIHAARTASSNFIYCLGYSGSSDYSAIQNIHYFILERTEVDEKDSTKQSNQTKILVSRAAQTEDELRKILSDREISQFLSQIKGESIQDILSYIRNNKNMKDVGPVYFSPKVKMAFGHLYEDKEIEKSKTYQYKIKAITMRGEVINWGTSVLSPRYTNHTLNYLRPKLLNSQLFDNTAVFKWYINVSQTARDSIIRPSPINNYNEKQMAFNEFNIANSLVQVSYYNKNGYTIGESLIGNLSTNGDSLFFYSTLKVEPGDFVSSFVRIADEFGNLGLSSDTAAVYAVSRDNVPILGSLFTDEIEDGIVISWEEVPYLPYISGIEIIRINSNNQVDTIGVFPKTTSSYIDYNIEIGQTYTYMAKLLFTPEVNVEQTIPAITTGQYSMFGKPSMPYELTANADKQNVRLDWKHDKNQSIFGYFIYRGTDYQDRQLLAGPVFRTSFLDTSDGLSGGYTYYYSVIAQNVMHDTSLHSNIAEIIPDRKIDLYPPLTADFYLTTEGLLINWQNVSELDPLVSGYKIYKKAKEDKSFTVLASNTPGVSFTDTAVNTGDKVQYMISSVSFRGDESAKSQIFYYDSKINHLAKMNTFSARNINDGILISIPLVIIPDRSKYKIYRQENDGETKLIGEINSGNFEFVDKSVRDKANYIYGISIVFSDGYEGKIGNRKSVTRKK